MCDEEFDEVIWTTLTILSVIECDRILLSIVCSAIRRTDKNAISALSVFGFEFRLDAQNLKKFKTFPKHQALKNVK